MADKDQDQDQPALADLAEYGDKGEEDLTNAPPDEPDPQEDEQLSSDSGRSDASEASEDEAERTENGNVENDAGTEAAKKHIDHLVETQVAEEPAPEAEADPPMDDTAAADALHELSDQGHRQQAAQPAGSARSKSPLPPMARKSKAAAGGKKELLGMVNRDLEHVAGKVSNQTKAWAVRDYPDMTLRHWKMPEDGEEFPCLLCDSPLGGYYDALCHVADNHCKERLAMTITVGGKWKTGRPRNYEGTVQVVSPYDCAVVTYFAALGCVHQGCKKQAEWFCCLCPDGYCEGHGIKQGLDAEFQATPAKQKAPPEACSKCRRSGDGRREMDASLATRCTKAGKKRLPSWCPQAGTPKSATKRAAKRRSVEHERDDSDSEPEPTPKKPKAPKAAPVTPNGYASPASAASPRRRQHPALSSPARAAAPAPAQPESSRKQLAVIERAAPDAASLEAMMADRASQANPVMAFALMQQNKMWAALMQQQDPSRGGGPAGTAPTSYEPSYASGGARVQLPRSPSPHQGVRVEEMASADHFEVTADSAACTGAAPTTPGSKKKRRYKTEVEKLLPEHTQTRRAARRV